MRQTWRWFGPADEITLPEVRQTGAEGIVSALHHIPTGEVWDRGEIALRKAMIEATKPLTWDVVESLPVSEDIKTQTGDYKAHIEAYRQSLQNLAEHGLRVVCYNFMPVLDWTRTRLAAPLANGGTAMRFDLVDFVVFDLFLLNRVGAEEDYSEFLQDAARKRWRELDNEARARLASNIVAGLPGANDRWTLDDVAAKLTAYDGFTPLRLKQHLFDFLSEIVPTAEDLGIRLCCHPDDPPFPLLGLPRIMSGLQDYSELIDAVTSPANGITFCTGSLGVSPDFDPTEFVESLGSHIHFVHLRNTMRSGLSDGDRHSFFEAEHLGGNTDLVATVQALMNEEARRRSNGRTDWQIPMRPDHGQALLSDLDRPMMPGYPLVGRMRGLAELRGIMAAMT